MAWSNSPLRSTTMSPDDMAALREAAEWFALLRSDHVTDADRQRWHSWHCLGPRQQNAWQRVESVNARFQGVPRETARPALMASANPRRAALKTLAVLCGSGLVAWQAERSVPWRQWRADYRTELGQMREIVLDDGSRIWLDTDSAIDVAFDDGWRRIVLRSGHLFVQTAPDTRAVPRPFVVETELGRLLPLGTRFAVRQEADAITVAVFEGAVQLRPANPELPPVVVHAGSQARLTSVGVQTPQPAQRARQAWTRGLLVADDMRLADVARELARYRRGVVRCAPAVADLRLVGIYPLTDIDGTLQAIEQTLPVSVNRVTPWWVSIGPRE